jgi:hypothetical protein
MCSSVFFFFDFSTDFFFRDSEKHTNFPKKCREGIPAWKHYCEVVCCADSPVLRCLHVTPICESDLAQFERPIVLWIAEGLLERMNVTTSEVSARNNGKRLIIIFICAYPPLAIRDIMKLDIGEPSWNRTRPSSRYNWTRVTNKLCLKL